MRLVHVNIVFVAALIFLAACDQTPTDTGGTPPASADVSSEEVSALPNKAQPNFKTENIGAVEAVRVEATGVGPTPLTATDAAIYNAIRQTNGESVYGASAQYGMAANLRSNFGNADIASEGFAQAIVSASGGTVLSFSLPEGPPIQKSGVDGDQYWTVKIAAEIAKYQRPDAAMRPGLVIADPRVASAQVSSKSFSNDRYAGSLKSELVGAIAGTNRFAAIDRELDAYVDSELSRSNFQSPDYARVGKQLSAEVIVIPTVEDVKYLKSTRTLKTSDRQLVSYNAAVQIRFDVINGTTGHTIFSITYSETPTVPAPSTLGVDVDPVAAIGSSTETIVDHFILDLLRNTFPVMVVSVSGDHLVLNQGGRALRTGEEFELVGSGTELLDPQTGQSLGAEETVLGKVRVDVVSEKTSIATYLGQNAEALAAYAPGSLKLVAVSNPAAPIATSIAKNQSSAELADTAAATGKSVGGNTNELAGSEKAGEVSTQKDDSDW